MKFLINKLGPIDEVELELEDITVLIGPPNVGKSYTLKALYSSLLMLDPTARNFLLKSTFNELDILKRRRLAGEEKIFRILINLAILYKIYPQKVEEVIKRISDTSNIGQINIKIENSSIIATSKKKENVSLKKLGNLIQEKTNLLWGILPTTDETEIILELSIPQLLPILIESLKKPIIIRWGDYNRHLKLHMSYSVFSKLQEKKAKLILEKTVEIRLDGKSPVIREGTRRLSEEIVHKLEKAKDKKETLKILDDLIIKSIPNLKRFMFWVMSEVNVVEVTNHTIDHLVENVGKMLGALYRSTLGIQSVLFIPFGRSPLVHQLEYISREPIFRQELLGGYYEFDIPLYSYMSKLSIGRAKLSEGNYEKEIVQLFEPVLQGNLMFDKQLGELKYKRWGFEELYQKQEYEGVSIKWASALAGEITGILLPILAVPHSSYLIIEEPESQLHYSAQVLMALALVGISKLFNHRIAFSTHSDIFAITLAYLKEFKPDKDKVLELIKKLLEVQSIYVEDSNLGPLAKAVSENADINIKFYYYKPTSSGVRVSERSSSDILKDVPGITDVVNTLTTWAMSL